MATPKKRKPRESWGRIRKLPSGRVQASYTGPDLALHKAVATFDGIGDARAWIHAERQMIDAGTWRPPATRNDILTGITIAAYADQWLAERSLKPRTRALYRSLLDQRIIPDLGPVQVKDLSPTAVRAWYGRQDPDAPTRRAHAYSLLRTILTSAVDEELITANPCRIRGAGSAKRQHKIRPATLPELELIIGRLPEHYRVMALLATWCALRFGELTELRRRDLVDGRILVRRAVTYVGGRLVVGVPKSDAGIRDVTIPPHLLPMVAEHVDKFAGRGQDGLIFPGMETGVQLTHGTFYKTWRRARAAAGREDLRFHDLRHSGAVMAAATGATLAELMNRLGHSTVGAAMRYQHAAQDRDAEIAALLSKMAEDAG